MNTQKLDHKETRVGLDHDVSASHVRVRVDVLGLESVDMRVYRMRQGNLDATAWEGSQRGEPLGYALPSAGADGPLRPAVRRVRSRVVTISVRKARPDPGNHGGELAFRCESDIGV